MYVKLIIAAVSTFWTLQRVQTKIAADDPYGTGLIVLDQSL